jgi:DNA-binding CsgD family transcriptional regulator
MAHILETGGFETFNEAPASDASPALPPLDHFTLPVETSVLRGWSCTRERQVDRPLSPRERQILTLIIDGKTRKEVAFDLEIAHSTVRVIYSRAMKKLGGRWQPLGRKV